MSQLSVDEKTGKVGKWGGSGWDDVRSRRDDGVEQTLYHNGNSYEWKTDVGTGKALARGTGEGFAGLTNALATVGSAIPMAGDAIAGVFGREGTPASDWYQNNVVGSTRDNLKFFQPSANEHYDTGAEVGRVGGNLASIFATAIPAGMVNFTGRAGAALSPMAQSLAKGTAAAETFAVPATINRAQDLVENGVDTETVMQGAASNYATNMAMGLLPASAAGNLLTRGLTGGALSVGTGSAQRGAEGAILGDKYAKFAEDPFDTKAMAFDAVLGTGFGAAFGQRPNNTGNKTKQDVDIEKQLEDEATATLDTQPLALPAPEMVNAVSPEGVVSQVAAPVQQPTQPRPADPTGALEAQNAIHGDRMKAQALPPVDMPNPFLDIMGGAEQFSPQAIEAKNAALTAQAERSAKAKQASDMAEAQLRRELHQEIYPQVQQQQEAIAPVDSPSPMQIRRAEKRARNIDKRIRNDATINDDGSVTLHGNQNRIAEIFRDLGVTKSMNDGTGKLVHRQNDVNKVLDYLTNDQSQAKNPFDFGAAERNAEAQFYKDAEAEYKAVEAKRVEQQRIEAENAALTAKAERSAKATEAARQRKQVSHSDSLETFIRKHGGISDGDFSRSFATRQTGNKGNNFQGGLTTYNGKSADAMAELAHEAGYIQERSPQALHDALSLEINQGIKQHTPEQIQDQAEADYIAAQKEPDISTPAISETGKVSDAEALPYDDVPFSRSEGESKAFVKASDGSESFGEIDVDTAATMKRQAGVIRLRVGNKDLGETHINRVARLKQIKAFGYDGAKALVEDVARNYNHIYHGRGSTLLLVKKNGNPKVAYIQLEPSANGDFYDVKSALVTRKDFFDKKMPLWERAQTNQLKESSSAVTSQSDNTPSIDQPTPKSQAKTIERMVKNGGMGALLESGRVKVVQSAKDLKGKLKHMVAWHGSPHDFEAFNNNKINTGFKTQNYGYGFYFTSHKEFANYYKNRAIKRGQKDAKLYKVDIPNETNLLDWNKPLLEQDEALQKAVGNMGYPYVKNGSQLKHELEFDLRAKGVEDYAKEASKILRANGIKGFKYESQGRVNYVIFNDKDVSITEKYSKQGDIQGAYDPKTDTIYLVADGLEKGDVKRVLAHEALHRALERMNKAEAGSKEHTQRTNIFKGLANMEAKGDAEVSAWFRDARKAAQVDKDKPYYHEEIAAYAVEQYLRHPKSLPDRVRRFVKSMIAKLKRLITQQTGHDFNTFKDADFTEIAHAELKRMGKEADTKSKPIASDSAQNAVDFSKNTDFGKKHTQFKHDAQGAIKQLMQDKDGEAVAALHHKDVGDIDLVWGEEGTGKSDGFGLAKLVKYHPEVVDDLQGVLDGLEVKTKSKNRVNLESENHKVAIRLDWNNQDKNWLLTAFEKNKDGAGRTTDISKLASKDDTAPFATNLDTKSIDSNAGKVKFSRSTPKDEATEAKENHAAVKSAIAGYLGGKYKAAAKHLSAFGKNVFFKPAQVVRDYGVKHARIISDKFLAEDGHEKRTSDAPDLMTQRYLETGKFLSRFQDIMQPLNNRFVMFDMDANGLFRGLPSMDNLRIVRGLRTGKVLPRLKEEAQALRDLLNDVRAYAIKAGLDIGELPNYFPRVYDVEKISKNFDKFVKFLEVDGGYSNKDAQKIAYKIINSEGSPELYGDSNGRVEVNEAGEVFTRRADGAEGYASKKSYEKGRTIDIPEKRLNKWLVNDVQAVLTQHISNVVRRAEYARRFGESEGKLNADVRKMIQELEDEGRARETHQAVRQVYDMADAAMGKYKPIDSEFWRNNNRVLSDAMVMVHLPFVTFSSMPEIFAPIVHGGRHAVIPLVKAAYQHAFKQSVNGVSKFTINKELFDKHEWTKTAEEMGLITQAALQQAVQARMGHKTGKWTNRFIRATMLEQVTSFQKVVANETFRAMMNSHAKKLEKGATGKKSEQILQDIHDYGLSESQVKAWAKDGTGEAELRMAGVNFSNKVISTPNEANTPLHVQNPHLAQLFLFKRFITIFSNTFLKRMLQQTTRGKTAEVKMQGIVGAVLMISAAYAAQSLRDDLKWGEGGNPYRKKDETLQRTFDAMDRAGFTGSATWLYAVFNPYRFGFSDNSAKRFFNLMGPAISDATKTYDVLAMPPKSAQKAAQKRGKQFSKLVPVLNATEATRKPLEDILAKMMR